VEWSNDLKEKKNTQEGECHSCHCQPIGQAHWGITIKPEISITTFHLLITCH